MKAALATIVIAAILIIGAAIGLGSCVMQPEQMPVLVEVVGYTQSGAETTITLKITNETPETKTVNIEMLLGGDKVTYFRRIGPIESPATASFETIQTVTGTEKTVTDVLIGAVWETGSPAEPGE